MGWRLTLAALLAAAIAGAILPAATAALDRPPVPQRPQDKGQPAHRDHDGHAAEHAEAPGRDQMRGALDVVGGPSRTSEKSAVSPSGVWSLTGVVAMFKGGD